MSARPSPARWLLCLPVVLALVISPPPSAAEQAIAGILFAENEAGKIFFPLKQTEVELEVTAGVVSGRVTQVFENDTESPLEAVYVFPLPSRAAITGMTLTIGDRTIRSVVKEKEEAKKTYEEARASGKKAALLEEERPNIFTTSVANFLPGETVEITFTYLEPIGFERDRYSVNFPMVVGQRYVPYDIVEVADLESRVVPAVADADRINPLLLHPNLDSGHRLALEVRVVGIPVAEVRSSTHQVEVTASGSGEFTVRPAGEVIVPDSDFNLELFLAESAEPGLSLVETRASGWGYGLITVFPPIGPGPSVTTAIPRDVVFLIDTSGSMSGESIGQARAGLDRCLEMLLEGDRFTIVRFACDYSAFSPVLREVSPSALAEARGYISGLEANGGTEMQPALEHVLGFPEAPGRMRLVVFLTDGDVGNEDSLLALLQRRLGAVRLFTFGIGSAPNEYLMRKMAELGRGESRFIRTEEDVGEVMDEFFRTLDSPVLTDIELHWRDAAGGWSPAVEFYPDPVPDVFAGRPLQVRAAYPAEFSGTLVVSGRLDGKPAEYEYPFPGGETAAYPDLDRLFARARVDDLMVQRLRTKGAAERERLKAEIIAVSIDHQILSPFTSRVAVEERVERREDGTLVSVKVAVPIPRGWGLSPTATAAPTRLLAGLAALLAAISLGLVRKRLSARR